MPAGLLREEKFSADSKTLFESAGKLDFEGREAEALPLYQQVLNNGYQTLPAEDQPRLFVQLGSTLRNLGQLSESRDVLLQGVAAFPENNALKAFLALTEYSSGNAEGAIQILSGVLLQMNDDSLRHYARSLNWYFENLSTTGPD